AGIRGWKSGTGVQPLRANRGYGLLDVRGDQQRERTRAEHRSAGDEYASLHTRRGEGGGAGRSGRRVIHRRRRAGERVLEESGYDGGEVRARRVWREGRRKDVRDGRLVQVQEGWRDRVSWADRSTGE